ncbi:helix-turn-helix domain-containing protein [Hirschia litorea]|uniref:Helix-turn-helix domain-containing protein n=1 Tax=Hirschia litorea TaxID=1199156 RepID=A0ABW2IQ64_9PROT
MSYSRQTPPEHRNGLDLLTTAQAAEFLKLSETTLCHYRCQGKGPIYRKHGWRIFYTKSDLIDWSEKQRWSSTFNKLRSN